MRRAANKSLRYFYVDKNGEECNIVNNADPNTLAGDLSKLQDDLCGTEFQLDKYIVVQVQGPERYNITLTDLPGHFAQKDSADHNRK